jgi:hypothetical protein
MGFAMLNPPSSPKKGTIMPNRHRGEIEAVLDGEPYRLCLTLGALAELEDAFGADDMLALAERFEAGRLSARDAVRIIAAGLRGGGNDMDDAQVARMQASGGAAGYVDIVARLLGATFGPGETAAPSEAALPGKHPRASRAPS